MTSANLFGIFEYINKASIITKSLHLQKPPPLRMIIFLISPDLAFVYEDKEKVKKLYHETTLKLDIF